MGIFTILFIILMMFKESISPLIILFCPHKSLANSMPLAKAIASMAFVSLSTVYPMQQKTGRPYLFLHTTALVACLFFSM
jgi:hypothetical protein